MQLTYLRIDTSVTSVTHGSNGVIPNKLLRPKFMQISRYLANFFVIRSFFETPQFFCNFFNKENYIYFYYILMTRINAKCKLKYMSKNYYMISLSLK